jgi:hypothetical protein
MPGNNTPHVGDLGTVIYLPTFAGTQPLDESLDLFTSRVVRLKPPGLAPLIEITDVPTEVDPADSVKKLKLVSGTDTGVSLTGVGNFALQPSQVGEWLAETTLGHVEGQWTSNPFPVFDLQRNLT